MSRVEKDLCFYTVFKWCVFKYIIVGDNYVTYIFSLLIKQNFYIMESN